MCARLRARRQRSATATTVRRDARDHAPASKANVLAGSLPLLDREAAGAGPGARRRTQRAVARRVAGGLTENEVERSSRPSRACSRTASRSSGVDTHIVARARSSRSHARIAASISFGRKPHRGRPQRSEVKRRGAGCYMGGDARMSSCNSGTSVSSTADFQALFSISLEVEEAKDLRLHRRQRRRQVHAAQEPSPACIGPALGQVLFRATRFDHVPAHKRVGQWASPWFSEGRRVFPA